MNCFELGPWDRQTDRHTDGLQHCLMFLYGWDIFCSSCQLLSVVFYFFVSKRNDGIKFVKYRLSLLVFDCRNSAEL